MASLWADYTFFDGPLSGLTLGTGGRYTGSSYGDPANSFKVGSYTVVDALVRYDLARVGMAGSNVALHVWRAPTWRCMSTTCLIVNTSPAALTLMVASGAQNVRSLQPQPSVSNFSFGARISVPVSQVGCYAGIHESFRYHFCTA